MGNLCSEPSTSLLRSNTCLQASCPSLQILSVLLSRRHVDQACGEQQSSPLSTDSLGAPALYAMLVRTGITHQHALESIVQPPGPCVCRWPGLGLETLLEGAKTIRSSLRLLDSDRSQSMAYD